MRRVSSTLTSNRADDRKMQTDPTTWRNSTDAAALLGISIRTLERRLAAGQYPSQIVNGRRLIDCGDDASDHAQIIAEAKAVADDSRRSSAIVVAAFERVHTAQGQMIARLESDVAQANRTRRRWAVVAVMAVGASIGLGWGVAVYGERVAQLTASVSAGRTREAAQVARIAFLETPVAPPTAPPVSVEFLESVESTDAVTVK